MNSLGLAIFAAVAVLCLATSSALPMGNELRQKQELAALLDQLHNTYQMARKRNFCNDLFLDSLSQDFCMRKRGGNPDDLTEFVSRNRRETAEEMTNE